MSANITAANGRLIAALDKMTDAETAVWFDALGDLEFESHAALGECDEPDDVELIAMEGIAALEVFALTGATEDCDHSELWLLALLEQMDDRGRLGDGEYIAIRCDNGELALL